MYNPNQTSAPRRSNAEFLRRMSGGDCGGCADNARPVFNSGTGASSCTAPTDGHMPSLAMVYSPVQEWRCIIESPEEALSEGTLFRELVKPFEGAGRPRSSR